MVLAITDSAFLPTTTIDEALRRIGAWIEFQGPGQYDSYRQPVATIWHMYMAAYKTFAGFTGGSQLIQALLIWEYAVSLIPDSKTPYVYAWQDFISKLNAQDPRIMTFCQASTNAPSDYWQFCKEYLQLMAALEAPQPLASNALQQVQDVLIKERASAKHEEYTFGISYAWYAFERVFAAHVADTNVAVQIALAWQGAVQLFEPNNVSQLLKSQFPHPKVWYFKQVAGLATDADSLRFYRDELNRVWMEKHSIG